MTEKFYVTANSNPSGTYVSASGASTTANPLDCGAATTFGSCQRTDCPYPFPSTTASSLNAGTLTVGSSDSPATLAFSGGAYVAYNSSSILWSGGTSIVASTAGGSDVAGFSLTTTVPVVGTLTSPVFKTTTGYQPLSTASAIDVVWTSTAADMIYVYLGGESSTTYSWVECDVPASSGAVQIPAAAMAGMAGINGILDVTAAGHSTQTHGSVEIDFDARSFLQMGSSIASVPVALQ